jgi:Ca2+-binding EF-hand superfamily protein
MAAFAEHIDWALINSHLPVKREEVDKRKAIWRKIDNNGNGIVSLAEMDKGIRHAIGLSQVFDAKPAIMRAFQYAKDSSASKRTDGLGDDFVEWREFRTFLVALRQRFEYWAAFCAIDTDGDRRINLAEFTSAKELIEKWVGPIPDAEATFQEIDANGGGQILFDEFCEWSLAKNLDLDDDEELL